MSEQKIVCHASGDRCHGCAHYHGKADVCEYADPAAETDPHTKADALVNRCWDKSEAYITTQSNCCPDRIGAFKEMLRTEIEALMTRLEAVND